jgi:hypothetical protein
MRLALKQRPVPVTRDEQAPCQRHMLVRKPMNILSNRGNIILYVDIFASFAGVKGDAPCQLVTKSVSKRIGLGRKGGIWPGLTFPEFSTDR